MFLIYLYTYVAHFVKRCLHTVPKTVQLATEYFCYGSGMVNGDALVMLLFKVLTYVGRGTGLSLRLLMLMGA